MGSEQFRNLSFMLVTHGGYVYGQMEALRDFLSNAGTRHLGYIAHPFQYTPEKKSIMVLYENGEVRTFHSPEVRAPQLILYLNDSVLTLLFVLISRRRYSVYVGADPLNAVLGLLLKSVRIVRHVVFYTLDYVPTRFNSHLLNSAYHAIDRICVEHCDYTWNVSQAITTARGREGVVQVTQLEVPACTQSYDELKNPEGNFERSNIVFIGHLRKGHGLELLLRAFPQVLEKVPSAKLIIIGGGPLEHFLRTEARDHNMLNSVDFRGYIKDREEVSRIISRCAFGLAPYEPSAETFTWFADSGKAKHYISCGLPVIITSVPRFSKEIEMYQAGLVVEYDEEKLADAMVKLLTDKALLDRMRLNAAELSQKYSWNRVFSRALVDTMKGISDSQVKTLARRANASVQD